MNFLEATKELNQLIRKRKEIVLAAQQRLVRHKHMPRTRRTIVNYQRQIEALELAVYVIKAAVERKTWG